MFLLDEPFNGMDVESKQKAMDVIREIKNNRGAVCISSHSTGELENICDAYLFINQGRVRGKGSIQELKSKLAISKHMSLASIYLKIMGG